MTTTKKEQLTGNEATLVNSARGTLTGLVEKLRTVITDAEDALAAWDAQLEDFDGDHPERSQLTTSQRREASRKR